MLAIKYKDALMMRCDDFQRISTAMEQQRDTKHPDSELATTSELIVQRSLRMFAGKGYDGVSMRDISDSVGITPGAIYHHFSGKAELFDKAVEKAFSRVNVYLVNGFGNATDPKERLREAILRLTQYIFSGSDEMRLVDRVVYEGSHPGFPQIMRQLRDVFASLVRNINDEVSPEEVAEKVISAVYGAWKLQGIRSALRSSEQRADARAFAESLGEFTLRALDRPA